MKLIVILGPTGVGKTETALTVAERLALPVINADSRQIYAGLAIGTAAPTAAQQQRVRHFFVGTLPPQQYYSASMYEHDVLTLLDKLYTQSDTALMAGGSMMYIDAVCNGIDELPTIPDNVRNEVKQQYEQHGLQPLLEELKAADPQYYEEVDRNNQRRVIHAIEICRTAGQPYSTLRTHSRKPRPFEVTKIGLIRDRQELYDRINRRVDIMMEQGLADEAHRFYGMRGVNALNTVGYKEMFDYFDGRCSLAEATERIKGATRRYCRKQLTWFRRDPSVIWHHPDDIDGIMTAINREQTIGN